MILSRQNTLRHLRTIHQPAKHCHCNRCGICVKTVCSLQRHKMTCHADNSLHRNNGHRCRRRLSSCDYVMLPPDYVADDYLRYVRSAELNDPKRNQHGEAKKCIPRSSAVPETPADGGFSSEYDWPCDPNEVRDIDAFQWRTVRAHRTTRE